MSLHLVVPDSIDDPRQPSGGNRYDRELALGLRSLGEQVHEHLVPVDGDLGRLLARLPARATVLVDGLVGLASGDTLAAQQHRLRLWPVVHLPLGFTADDHSRERVQERRALMAATGVLTTSEFTRGWLLDTYGLSPSHVRVAPPGVDAAPLSRGTPGGRSLVCVGAVVPDKGHDALVEALASLADLPWTCRIVGSLDRAPAFVERLRWQVERSGLGERVRFTGPLSPAAVAAVYDESDLLVHPTLMETYGMVVTEALARGLPVVASDTGGVAEAVGAAPDSTVPGDLVPPGDAGTLASSLRRWLEDSDRRRRLRASARARRPHLSDWSATASLVREALLDVPVNRSGLANVVGA